MITFCPSPIPCKSPLGDGYIIYIKDNGMFENDEATVVLLEDGSIKHFDLTTINVWHNETYGIKKK